VATGQGKSGTMRQEGMAKLACAYSGIAWGLFWIPLRALEAKGIVGPWATAMFYGVPFVLVLPVLAWRWRQTRQGGLYLQATGIALSLGLVLYAVSVLHTEVIRAMLLFYLTPIWSALFARLALGEPITPIRWLAMALGMAGLAVILGVEAGLPWPRNAGDWMALASGVLWAVAAVMLRARPDIAPPEYFTQNFFWSGLVALAFVLLAGDWASTPASENIIAQLPWFVPASVIVVMSGAYATMWGAPKLNPAVVGLMFMTEIVSGTVTAALWAGEPFGWREILGIVLIAGAGLAESLYDLINPRRAAPATSRAPNRAP
jgi:drug/metabolite transporter (DMT)-like permease